MKIHVKTFATFREVMDDRFDMEYPQGATIRTLLDDLIKKYRRDGRTDICQSRNDQGLCQHPQERQECAFS